MADTGIATAEGLSETERDLLRESVRDLLARYGSPEADISIVWREIAAQGYAAVGIEQDGIGLRDTLLLFEELGRAACPAPLLGALCANLLTPMLVTPEHRQVIEALHHGDAIIALALAGYDGDDAAGRVAVGADGLLGHAAFVEGVQDATHILVFTNAPDGIAIVANNAAGLSTVFTPGLAVPAFATLRFEHTPATHVPVPASLLKNIAVVARLACAARALGAAQRAFDLAVDHAKLRKQFGRLIGQFQAVQHKLADCLISLDGARLSLEAAAEARDQADPDWRVFAAAALAFAGPALREVSIQTHRALGAIGYAEEHEAPRHFRRVHTDLARFGGVTHARSHLASVLLDPGPNR